MKIGWIVGCHIGIKCKLCIQDLELSYTQPSCCRGFTAAKILPNSKLEKVKEKILYEV